jgi:hypothetical protein
VSVPSLESESTLEVCLEYPFCLCLFGVSILSLFVRSIHFVSVCLEYPFCLFVWSIHFVSVSIIFALDFQTVLKVCFFVFTFFQIQIQLFEFEFY